MSEAREEPEVATGPGLLQASVVTRLRSQEHALWRSRLFYLVTALAVVSIFLPGHVAWFLVLGNACMLGLALVYKLLAQREHLISRDAQRLALLEDSLGQEALSFDHTEILKNARLGDDWRHVVLPDSYYTTEALPGRARLAINIAESAFFSRSLLEAHKTRIVTRICVSAVVIVVGALLVLATWATPNRFLAITAAATMLVAMTDDIESVISVSGGIRAFEQLDRKLHEIIENHGLDDEHVLSTFGDYAVASAVAPPIPSGLYGSNREQLDFYWSDRRSQYEKAATEDRDWNLRVANGRGGTIRLFEHFGAFPEWLTAEQRCSVVSGLLPAANLKIECDALEVLPVSGMGEAPVVLARLFYKGQTFVQYFVKFYRSNASAHRELKMLRSLGYLSADYFPKLVEDELLIALNVVATYSVACTGHKEYVGADRALRLASTASGSESQPIGEAHNALSECIKVLPGALAPRGNAISSADRAEVVKQLKAARPRCQVADLRRTNWSRRDGIICVRATGEFGSTGRGTTQPKPRMRFLLDGWADTATAAAECCDDPDLVVLIPSEMVSGTQVIMEIEFDSVANLESLKRPIESQLQALVGGDWTRTSLSEMYSLALQCIGNDAELALCHRDLHLGNVLVADGMFKVIDLFSVGFDLAYVDVCRLQVSALCTLLQSGLGASASFIESVCDYFSGRVDETRRSPDSLMEWIVELRASFDSGRRQTGSEREYVGTLLLESIRQAYFSILSERPVGREWPRILGAISSQADTLARDNTAET